ncbi:uncharacterized protein LOC134538862 isoform X2 [Bacillus rossius redtenbacheri]|uniref:uncharacterized protein LOC134538862 isoform X2 n=1 Tax=Bacillus rossius redtenbacheri TaxID=93214 RepID=UPI002FDC905B
MSYSTQKLAVRDSFDDEDISDDVEDEVFIRDGRNGFRADEERGVKRPLMAPKRKSKSGLLHSEPCKRNSWRNFCIPCCYGILALTALIGLIAGAVGLVLWLPLSMDQVVFWKHQVSAVGGPPAAGPCPGLQARDVWARPFPKLTVESALVAADVTGDGVADVVVGYGTDFSQFLTTG